MEELTLPQLSTEQLETLCTKAEDAARNQISSRVPSKSVEHLNVIVEVEGSEILNLLIDIDLVLKPHTNSINAKQVVDEAIKRAFRVAEDYLRTLK